MGDETPQPLGVVLKSIRSARGLTMREMASLTGVSSGYISLLEQGKRVASLDYLERVSSKTGVPLFVIVFMGNSAELPGELNRLLEEYAQAVITKEEG